MASFQAVLLIKLRVPGRVLLRHKIFPGEIIFIGQAASHDLLYLTVVDIDTWTKTHKFLSPLSNHFPYYNRIVFLL